MAAAAAAASVLDTKTCNDVTANVGIIVTGNSGVGKSLLVNVLLGENRFQHGISATSVTEKVDSAPLDLKLANGKSTTTTLYNLPGLFEADSTRLERNKKCLSTAFSRHKTQVVVFVMGNQNGRLMASDIEAFVQLTTVYSLTSESTVLVFNQAKSKPDWKTEALVLFRVLTGWTKNLHVVFTHEMPVESDSSISCTSVSAQSNKSHLLSAIGRCTPTAHLHTGQLCFTSETLKHMQEKLKKMQSEMVASKEAYAVEKKAALAALTS